MIELRKNLTADETERLLDLYESAFPPDERRPREQMPPADEAFTLYAVGEAGLLTAWDFGGWTYVEHFAVWPSQRGGGIGSQALAALPGPVILEVEPPEDGEMERRRVEFYRRNGFRLLDVDYVQPPYAPDKQALSLRLMVRGELPVAIDEAIRTLHRRVYAVAPEQGLD